MHTGRLLDTVAWVLIEGGRILCARPHDADVFFVPGGKREGDETDLHTLLREIHEELTVALVPDTVAHVGTYEAPLSGTAGPGTAAGPGAATGSVRMACYTADYTGIIVPSSEIADIAWFGYGERALVPPVDQLLFDDLVAAGWLPDHDIDR